MVGTTNQIQTGSVPLPINNGGTGVTTPVTTPTPGSFVGWDVNSDLHANSFVPGYQTTVTSAGTTTLTVASPSEQFFTGTTTETVLMPVVSTLTLGQKYFIVNKSTDVVTVNSSGGGLLVLMGANTFAIITCIAITGTGSSSWSVSYSVQSIGVASLEGTADLILTAPQNIGSTSSPTFNNLQLSSNILGSNGLMVVSLDSVASAVNAIELQNAPTGLPSIITAAGSDVNIGISVVTKGSGDFTVSSSGATDQVTFYTGGSYVHETKFSFPSSPADQTVTWQDASGTVAFLSDVGDATGTANQVLVNGTSGTPQTGSITLTTPQDIATTSSPTFNNIQLDGVILGDNGLAVMGLNSSASAVNYIELKNSPTAIIPSINAEGTDANVGLLITSKGTGPVHFESNSTSNQFSFFTDAAGIHETIFSFPSGGVSRTVTWQDSSGTVAYLTDAGLLPYTAVPAQTSFPATGNGYIVTNNTILATIFNLPATATLGAIVVIQGFGSAGWILQANAGQNIQIGSVSSSVGGTVSSSSQFDCIEIICVVADTTWAMKSSVTAAFNIT